MKVKFSRQIFEKYSKIKFHENPSSGSRTAPWGRTDRKTDEHTWRSQQSFFRNFANAPKNSTCFSNWAYVLRMDLRKGSSFGRKQHQEIVFFKQTWRVFTARYALIRQLSFMYKGFMETYFTILIHFVETCQNSDTSAQAVGSIFINFIIIISSSSSSVGRVAQSV